MKPGVKVPWLEADRLFQGFARGSAVAQQLVRNGQTHVGRQPLAVHRHGLIIGQQCLKTLFLLQQNFRERLQKPGMKRFQIGRFDGQGFGLLELPLGGHDTGQCVQCVGVSIDRVQPLAQIVFQEGQFRLRS